MRKIVASLFISLDGVVEAPDQWHMSYFDDEMGEAVGGLMSDTMLYGRKTYDGFAEAWPQREGTDHEDAEFAKILGDARKIVVSRGEVDLSWRNSEKLQGDLVTGVTALKKESGGDVSVGGSVSVIRELLRHGLLDELHLLVHPVAVRRGERLFDEGDAGIPLKLLDSKAFGSGVLHLVYGPAD
ncbi:dihydrofolate reductase family protein [Streptomyces sp. B8F3]|uniref:dihydrofolate reductase family protein n=1 Tax=unclassified Streptomyces TaxID=2593676 RepID=UPI00325DF10B